MAITAKEYKCEKCGNITTIETNHDGSFRGCRKCGDRRAYLICQTDAGITLFAKQQAEKKALRASLPVSILRTTKQEKTFKKLIKIDGEYGRIECNIRWDDTCYNNHNSLGVTGTIYTHPVSDADRYFHSAGCIHDEIAKHFPELKHLIKWHCYTSDGYMYVSNISYWAKQGDIATARRLANWDDATLEQLQDEALLMERLPMLMLQMKADIEALGMVY